MNRLIRYCACALQPRGAGGRLHWLHLTRTVQPTICLGPPSLLSTEPQSHAGYNRHVLACDSCSRPVCCWARTFASTAADQGRWFEIRNETLKFVVAALIAFASTFKRGELENNGCRYARRFRWWWIVLRIKFVKDKLYNSCVAAICISISSKLISLFK